MHQARHIRGDDIVGAGFADEVEFVVSHLGGHCFLSNGERSAKATAFVRSLEIDELNPRNALQQLFRFLKLGVVYAFAHRSQAEAAHRGTTGVEYHLVIELGPRELTYLQEVV
jgi:hypothetical protein